MFALSRKLKWTEAAKLRLRHPQMSGRDNRHPSFWVAVVLAALQLTAGVSFVGADAPTMESFAAQDDYESLHTTMHRQEMRGLVGSGLASPDVLAEYDGELPDADRAVYWIYQAANTTNESLMNLAAGDTAATEVLMAREAARDEFEHILGRRARDLPAQRRRDYRGRAWAALNGGRGDG